VLLAVLVCCRLLLTVDDVLLSCEQLQVTNETKSLSPMKSNDHKRHSHFNSHHQHKYFATSSPNYEPEKKVLLVDGENGLGEVEVTPTHSKLNVSLSKFCK